MLSSSGAEGFNILRSFHAFGMALCSAAGSGQPACYNFDQKELHLAMEKRHYNLRTNIGYLLNQAKGTFHDFHVEFPEIYLDPDLDVFNLKCDYRFTRNHEGILLQADLQGEIETHCTRCLEAMKVTADTHFEELFVFVERSQEEFEQLVPEDGYIDLAEPFRDYLLLEIPIHHLCRPDCKGICLECGQNLNLGQCEHINSQILFD